MTIVNATFNLNQSKAFGWQILNSVVLTDTYNTLFHSSVLPFVVKDTRKSISLEIFKVLWTATL